MSNQQAELMAELERVQTEIQRLRQAQESLIQQRMARGVSEAEALGEVTQLKSYQALRRDENLHLSMLLRLSNRVEKLAETPKIVRADNVTEMPRRSRSRMKPL